MNHRFGTVSARKTMRVAGLMSGTSADGVDAAVTEIRGRSVRVLAHGTVPYSRAIRERVYRLFDPETSRVNEICRMNFILGEVFAEALLRLLRDRKIPPGSLDLVGSHGQTIYHIPCGDTFRGRRLRSTLQIGEPSVIAERTGITTVADFRCRDIAAGGEGAPLVPFADHALFSHPRKSRAVLNIGGIANVTWLSAGTKLPDVIAFDTGPGNMAMDRAARRLTKGRRRYDRDGRMAARGVPDEALLSRMLRHPFLRRKPPKSTGREMFGDAFADAWIERALRRGRSPEDVLATLTAFTARSIVDAFRRHLPARADEVILCGGGAHNGAMVSLLKKALAPAAVLLTDDFGIAADAKEAVSFAVLAHAAVKGIPNNVPGATGAAHSTILGKIVPGGER